MLMGIRFFVCKPTAKHQHSQHPQGSTSETTWAGSHSESLQTPLEKQEGVAYRVLTLLQDSVRTCLWLHYIDPSRS